MFWSTIQSGLSGAGAFQAWTKGQKLHFWRKNSWSLHIVPFEIDKLVKTMWKNIQSQSWYKMPSNLVALVFRTKMYRELSASKSLLFVPYWDLIWRADTKNYWKKKKRLCVRLRSGDKHHLRKSADRKAQISPVSRTNAVLICAFRSADFLRWCLSPERNLTHNLFFYFQ